MSTAASPSPCLLEAQSLRLDFDGSPVFEGLSFALGPGLHLVRGGDGRGKSTLMRLLAGTLTAGVGTLRRHTDSVFLADPARPVGELADDRVVAAAALESLALRFPPWQAGRAVALVESLGLAPHVHKPIGMLSTGSRRKLGIVAAAASGAALTLIDAPYAALDTPSTRALDALLRQAADDAARAWVIADHEAPRGLQGLHWASVVDLGD